MVLNEEAGMQDFEKLGAFYLGKQFDLQSDQLEDNLILYDSADLTTHAVIIGMTGSGKTGLGVSLIEEAALDRVPVIAVDPKGDLGNLLLTFPQLKAESFKPWIDPREAKNQGQSPEEFAAAQAKLWRKGLKDWGQSAKRIKSLRQAAEMAIYTPGSSAGIPLSVLSSFKAPPQELKNDKDLYRQKISATATSILALLGIAADPITSREHILISNILERAWNASKNLELPDLIAAIQKPSFNKIGVMALETMYPAKERIELAMQMNNLLAAPGFEVWREGPPLDAQRLFYADNGKPRISVVSIAHLSDHERMFFVTMLLNEVLSWLRKQPGTGSLRAILYMDEVFGYMPPTAQSSLKDSIADVVETGTCLRAGSGF